MRRRARADRKARAGEPSPTELLWRAAERAATHPFFLAALLLPYAQAEGLGRAELAARLGCSPEALPKLLLCRQPRSDPGAYRTDVERIAAAFGLEAERLAATLRLAQALQALRAADQAAGQLAAARDREPEAQEPETGGEETEG
ncbi:MAG TPA: hypothetical protein VFB73_05475 [Chloroflexota bacterium]|nr:hypothetical protein [Chloroflexota bacterium]